MTPRAVEPDIRSAQDQMRAELRKAQITNDPMAPMLDALLATASAFDAMTADVGRQIEAAKQPVRDDELRRAVIQGISGHAGALVRSMDIRTALLAAGMLFAMLLVGVVGGYWLRGESPSFVGLRASSDRCEDQSDGSRICWTPLYERLPK